MMISAKMPLMHIFPSGCRRIIRFLLAAAFLSVGCTPPASIPIETITYAQPAQARHSLLIVYLPGNGDRPAAFERHGLLDALRKRGIPADVVGVNAHLGYYTNGSIFRRLEEDVIGPARQKGYDRIWLVGNSLGAYGSLAYLGRHSREIAGAVLLGPFVADKETLDEVNKAGGLTNWNPGPVDPTDWKRGLMLLLKDYKSHPDSYPPIYLGYGRHDRFEISQRFLAGLLPPERVLVLAGGHEWWTWSKLWEQFLDKGIIK